MAKSEGGVAVLELPATKAEGQEEKRLNLILSAGAYADLAKLAKLKRTTMTEIVRLALGLIKVAISEADQNHKLVVTTGDGKVLKELILPG
jgi:hypothetical protein